MFFVGENEISEIDIEKGNALDVALLAKMPVWARKDITALYTELTITGRRYHCVIGDTHIVNSAIGSNNGIIRDLRKYNAAHTRKFDNAHDIDVVYAYGDNQVCVDIDARIVRVVLANGKHVDVPLVVG